MGSGLETFNKNWLPHYDSETNFGVGALGIRRLDFRGFRVGGLRGSGLGLRLDCWG